MKFEYIDIGTCDFETSADVLGQDNSAKVMLVEPLRFYLDRISKHDRLLKSNFAIGNRKDVVNIYYLEESTIQEYKLPHWLKGCSTVGKPHHLALKSLNEKNLPLDLLKRYEVQMITFVSLCEIYNVTDIGQLKLDTEGYEHLILPDVLRQINNGLAVNTIIYEYQAYAGNTDILDKLCVQFEAAGYKKSWHTNIDIKLTR